MSLFKPVMRPCLARRCPNLVSSDSKSSYCPDHQDQDGRVRNRSVTNSHRWRQLRKTLIAEAPKPLICAIHKGPIPDGQIELDHITPLLEGGDPYDRSNLRLTCRRCNRARRMLS